MTFQKISIKKISNIYKNSYIISEPKKSMDRGPRFWNLPKRNTPKRTLTGQQNKKNKNKNHWYN